MIILGLDPGTATTGFGIINAISNNKSIVAYGAIKTDKNLELSDRLLQIGEDLEILINKYKPDIASIEKIYFSTNVKTAISVSHARGVLLYILKKMNIPILEYTPLQVKQGLTGYGKANKQDIQTMVKLELNLNTIPKPDDAADALALCIIAINQAKKIIS